MVEFDVGKALFGLDPGRVRAPRRTAAGAGQGGAPGAHRRAPQPGHRLLQDGDVRRGDARVPARGRAAAAESGRPLPPRADRPAQGRRPLRPALPQGGRGAGRRARLRLSRHGAVAGAAGADAGRALRGGRGGAPGPAPAAGDPVARHPAAQGGRGARGAGRASRPTASCWRTDARPPRTTPTRCWPRRPRATRTRRCAWATRGSSSIPTPRPSTCTWAPCWSARATGSRRRPCTAAPRRRTASCRRRTRRWATRCTAAAPTTTRRTATSRPCG